MSRASSQMLDVAAWLIAHETSDKKPLSSVLPTAFHVCEKLRPHLATLMGKAGFRAVLSRALAVASGEIQGLAVVQVTADGTLEGWEKMELQGRTKEWAEAEVLLVAQLLGLLVAFIGHSLTLRLVREIWPRLSLDDLKFTQGDPS